MPTSTASAARNVIMATCWNVDDPTETVNIADGEPELASELTEHLEARVAETLTKAGRDEDPIRFENVSMGKKAIKIGRKRRGA